MNKKMDYQSRKLVLWQRTIFFVLFIGYMLYMLDRRSFSFNIPNIRKLERLESEGIGSVLSALAIGYAIGKFVSGIMVDIYSPTHMFATGLILCGGVNIAFSITSSAAFYSILWFCNGVFQGLGWPPCGKLLQRWYSPLVFGTMWSLLSTSMNVAASIGPFLCNFIADFTDSWRFSMQIFGAASIFWALIVLLLVSNNPTQCGFSTNNLNEILKGTSDRDNFDSVKREEHLKDDRNTPKMKQSPSFMTAMKRVFSSPYIYVVSLGFFVSLLCKVAVGDWGPLYIITEKNASKTAATVFAGSLEFGGIVGSVLSGMVSDWILSKRLGRAKGHPRNLFAIPCAVLLLLCLFCLRTFVTDVPSQHALTMSLAFATGFCLYALISVFGVMTIERTAADISGRSHAVSALFGNLGMTAGGLPFSIVIKNYSWSSAFVIIEIFVLFLVAVLSMSERMTCRIGDLKKEE